MALQQNDEKISAEESGSKSEEELLSAGKCEIEQYLDICIKEETDCKYIPPAEAVIEQCDRAREQNNPLKPLNNTSISDESNDRIFVEDTLPVGGKSNTHEFQESNGHDISEEERKVEIFFDEDNDIAKSGACTSFICDICGMEFVLERGLDKHKRQQICSFHHNCDYCGRGFSEKNRLKAHIITKHTKEFTIRCELCMRGFGRKGDLQTHSKICGKRKVIERVCKTCGKTFSQKSQLIRHEEAHQNVKQFLCVQCPKQFADNRNLKIHVEKHHPDLMYLFAPKEIKCGQCDDIFNTKIDIEFHKIDHHGQKPHYVCERCEKPFPKFIWQKTVKKHNMTCVPSEAKS